MQEETFDLPKSNSKITIKDFEQLKVLGKGSYAKVTLVRKIQDQKIYAMKILKKQFLAKKKQELHTITERNILVQCSHPFIIDLICSFQTEKKLFFVLEFCQGGELFNLLCKKRRLSEEVTRFYVSQMVLALEYLHSKDIIYRDLKPENVLIDNSGYIRIADFGLSKTNIVQNDAKSVCGTPEYLAPEVLAKQGHGKAVDWWTLGCLIYELVTGAPPFYVNEENGDAKESRKKLFEQIKEEDIKKKLHSKMSPELRDLLQRLLCKDFNTRLGTNGASEVKAHPWFQKVSWQYMLEKKIQPPFIPKIKDATDVQNFEDEFTQDQVHSVNDKSLKDEIAQSQYYDFSYAGDDLTHHNQHEDNNHHNQNFNNQQQFQYQQNMKQRQNEIYVTQNPDEMEMEMEE